MARTRSAKVRETKERLLARIREGHFRPGDRFLSVRAVAARFEISYQTAHRLLAELSGEGHLERRPASGLYLPGGPARYQGVELVFHHRARRTRSFGSRLLQALTGQLERERIPFKMRWMDPLAARGTATRAAALSGILFPVLWECPGATRLCVEQQRQALLLNERPASGLASLFLDSVSVDDYSGGVCAAELLERRAARGKGFAVLAGPEEDERSARRVAGFRARVRAAVVYAGGWYYEDGARVAEEVVRRGRRGIFCCNDRLAEAVLDHCAQAGRPRPALIGFDDAPVAAERGLTTIAIPWTDLVNGAVNGVIKQRLAGGHHGACSRIFPPHPVLREL